MKKILSTALSLFLVFSLLATLVSCSPKVDMEKLWQSATHTENREFGTGDKVFYLDVICGEHSVTFTINTNETYVADALLEHELVAGDSGAYGLYIKSVNGIRADYDLDKAYWNFTVQGETSMLGASQTEIQSGAKYEFTCTAG